MRPKDAQPYEVHSIRFEPDEWMALCKYAAAQERSPSEMVRIMVRWLCKGEVPSCNTMGGKRNTRNNEG